VDIEIENNKKEFIHFIQVFNHRFNMPCVTVRTYACQRLRGANMRIKNKVRPFCSCVFRRQAYTLKEKWLKWLL
jgi:hypothetical protein